MGNQHRSFGSRMSHFAELLWLLLKTVKQLGYIYLNDC